MPAPSTSAGALSTASQPASIPAGTPPAAEDAARGREAIAHSAANFSAVRNAREFAGAPSSGFSRIA
jgi:hypothetical protein